MINLKMLCLMGLVCISSYILAKDTNVRLKENINREWKFILKDMKGAECSEYNDMDWMSVSLPHSFSIPYFMWHEVYSGYGWYRKEIEVPTEWKDKNITLEFEGSFIETEIYVNGINLGKHTGGYTGFFFDITPHLNLGKNLIAVRVNNLWRPDVAPRAGDHQFSGGIYRDVYLNITDKLHVDLYGTYLYTPQVNNDKATCELQAEIRNNYDEEKRCLVRTEIKSPKGKVVSIGETEILIDKLSILYVKQTFPTIAMPELWSPETPQLYKAVTEILIDGKVIDRYDTPFGIRWFEWTADRGFFLNGKHYYLRGANVHQDQAGWGDAVTNAAIRRDVQMIKDAGFNCIRGSHYPHDPAFSQACDEIGLVFFQENAFWGMGGSSGDRNSWGPLPSSCYPPNIKDQQAFNQSVLGQLKEMIKIHRNHASIAAWSMCNEPFFTDDITDDAMKSLLKVAVDSARIWDPMREIAIGGAQRKWVDRLGKNTIAFYNGDGASREEFQCPSFPNLVSEYGSTTAHRPGNFFAGWGDILSSPVESNDPWNPPSWRSGHIIWCGFDHGTVGGIGLATMGIIDYFRLPKRQYYWYKEAYKNGNKNPVEPEWPRDGIPAKLKLETSNNKISSINGTDDAQLVVTVLDKTGKHINYNLPVELSIISGPGEFPTGRKITFMPPSDKEESDITIRDGQAAIAFRSYYGGKAKIKAFAEGLEPAIIEIEIEGTPKWKEGTTTQTTDRIYKRYSNNNTLPAYTNEMLLAANRPSWVSSTKQGTNKANVNDGDIYSIWEPLGNDTERWWKLALEASYCIDRIRLEFPTEDVYQYIVEVSNDGIAWTKIVDYSKNTSKSKMYKLEGNFGCDIAFLRIKFFSKKAGLADVKVGGTTTRD